MTWWIVRRALTLLIGGALLASDARSQTTNAELAAHEAFFFTPPGFDREGQPMWAMGANTGQVRIAVRDVTTGKITPCRINVAGADGNFYQPAANRLSPYALTGQWPTPNNWGNRFGKAPYRYIGRFFYTTGDSMVAVPAGDVRVEVWKGYGARSRPSPIST